MTSDLHHPVSSAEYRRWARQCEMQAKDPRASGEERDRLMRMKTSLERLAKDQDWLDGRAAS